MSNCNVCFHHCNLSEGQVGFCKARKMENGKTVSINANQLTSIAYDPIEKKPLAHFHAKSKILSVGSFGCNLRCPFCQNYQISMQDQTSVLHYDVSSDQLVDLILENKENLGIAFTYNEPCLYYEWIIEIAKKVRPLGKNVVLVSNGCFKEEIIQELALHIDAANIDLKGDQSYYQELQGNYWDVKKTIESLVKQGVHVEVTILVVPGKNDSPFWIQQEARWLAQLNEDIVLHLTRYFPAYQSTISKTPIETMIALQEVALKELKYVFLGNV